MNKTQSPASFIKRGNKHYLRHIHIDEKIEWITTQRIKCLGCSKNHAVLPDFIRPYKHYSACDAELVLRDQEKGIPIEKIETAASISTISRWIKEFKYQGQQMAGALRSLLYRYAGSFAKFRIWLDEGYSGKPHSSL